MFNKCCVNSCKFNKIKKFASISNVQFYKFPISNEHLLKKWKHFLFIANRKEVGINRDTLLCSDHFEPNQFKNGKLKPEAVPTKVRSLSVTTKSPAPKSLLNGSSKDIPVIVISDSDDEDDSTVKEKESQTDVVFVKQEKKPKPKRPIPNGIRDTSKRPKTQSKSHWSKEVIEVPYSPFKLPEVALASTTKDVIELPPSPIKLPEVEPQEIDASSPQKKDVIELPPSPIKLPEVEPQEIDASSPQKKIIIPLSYEPLNSSKPELKEVNTIKDTVSAITEDSTNKDVIELSSSPIKLPEVKLESSTQEIDASSPQKKIVIPLSYEPLNSSKPELKEVAGNKSTVPAITEDPTFLNKAIDSQLKSTVPAITEDPASLNKVVDSKLKEGEQQNLPYEREQESQKLPAHEGGELKNSLDKDDLVKNALFDKTGKNYCENRASLLFENEPDELPRNDTLPCETLHPPKNDIIEKEHDFSVELDSNKYVLLDYASEKSDDNVTLTPDNSTLHQGEKLDSSCEVIGSQDISPCLIPTEQEDKNETSEEIKEFGSQDSAPCPNSPMPEAEHSTTDSTKNKVLANEQSGSSITSEKLTEMKEFSQINRINQFLHYCRSLITEGDEAGCKILQKLQRLYLKAKSSIAKHPEFPEFLESVEAKIEADKQIYVHILEVYAKISSYISEDPSTPKAIMPSSPVLIRSLSSSPVPPQAMPASPAPSRPVLKKDNPSTSTTPTSSCHPNEERLQRHIAKLENLLEKLDKKIRQLELKEISLDKDDDDETAYILEDRFKRRFMKVHRKLCELKKQSASVGKATQKKFAFKDSPCPDLPQLTSSIETFINRHCRERLPDYHDILKIIEDTHSTSPIPNYNDLLARNLAQNIFTCVGSRLQERRKRDFRESLVCYATLEAENPIDPADQDPDLKKKLEESSKMGHTRLQEVMDAFVLKQSKLRSENSLDKENEKSEDSLAKDEDGEKENEEEDDEEDKDLSIAEEEPKTEAEESEEEDDLPFTPIAQSIFDLPVKRKIDQVDLPTSSLQDASKKSKI